MTGRRIVEMVREDLTSVDGADPRRRSRTPSACCAAIGGSTNAVVHLLAHRRPVGDRAAVGRLRPAGVATSAAREPAARRASTSWRTSATPAACPRCSPSWRRARPEAPTVTGRPSASNLDGAASREPRSHPTARGAAVSRRGGIAVLRGNLCARRRRHQAVRRHVRSCLQHRGRAVVFETIEDFTARDRRSRPRRRRRRRAGAAGTAAPRAIRACPRSATCRLPAKLLAAGRHRHGPHLRRPHERHRVRHRGAARRARKPRPAGRWRWCGPATRSSSTSPARTLTLDVDEAELAGGAPLGRRRAPRSTAAGGSSTSSTVMQADKGADLDFLVGGSGDLVTRESH